MDRRRDVRIDYHFGIGSTDKTKATITELLARPPDVVVAYTSATVATLRKAMPTVPMVFLTIYEPVAQGFVQSLAHPGGNATGFTMPPATIGGKWLELLSVLAPALACVAYMCSPSNPGPLRPYAAVEAAAQNRALKVAMASVQSATDIQTVMTALAREPGGGLILPPDGFLLKHYKLIIELAAHEKLPAIYGWAYFAEHGGLASYGINAVEQNREAGIYVGRILRGEKPADLPAQQPSRYELVINLKTAKTIGLNIAPAVLAGADKVIE